MEYKYNFVNFPNQIDIHFKLERIRSEFFLDLCGHINKNSWVF